MHGWETKTASVDVTGCQGRAGHGAGLGVSVPSGFLCLSDPTRPSCRRVSRTRRSDLSSWCCLRSKLRPRHSRNCPEEVSVPRKPAWSPSLHCHQGLRGHGCPTHVTTSLSKSNNHCEPRLDNVPLFIPKDEGDGLTPGCWRPSEQDLKAAGFPPPRPRLPSR